jgi:tRNA pseudouridine55 synthase
MQKVGHTGTLDPLATGVLPLCFGKATRLVSYLTEQEKCYRATLRLGEVTETGDTASPVIRSVQGVCIGEDEVRCVMERFVGVIEQVPPMYSAIKVGGIPLYRRARAGQVLERQPRRVTIHHLMLIQLSGRDVTFEVTCSKGTYIRSLCVDFGEALGVGAHVIELKRLRSGPFRLEEAITLETLEQLRREGRLEEAIYSMDEVLSLPLIRITAAAASRVLCGLPIRGSGVLSMPEDFIKGSRLKVHDPEGELIAIVSALQESRVSGEEGDEPLFKAEAVLGAPVERGMELRSAQ